MIDKELIFEIKKDCKKVRVKVSREEFEKSDIVFMYTYDDFGTEYIKTMYSGSCIKGSVVSCKNCKHCDIDSDTGYAYCYAWQRGTNADWYCSRGEQE